MWNTVVGESKGRPARRDYYMWVDAEPENRISSMGRATAFPAAVAAVMMGRGAFATPGILAPEDAFDDAAYRQLLDALETRGIVIEEVIT
jgi:saccharopine dehydrogenase-like NADP-dependent oxidoreductase